MRLRHYLARKNICYRTRYRTSMPLPVCFDCLLRVTRCCWEVERDWTRGTGATGCLRFTTIVVDLTSVVCTCFKDALFQPWRIYARLMEHPFETPHPSIHTQDQIFKLPSSKPCHSPNLSPLPMVTTRSINLKENRVSTPRR